MKITQIEDVRSKLNGLLNRKVVYGVSEFSIIDFKYDSRISKFIITVDDRDEHFELGVDAAVDFVRECRLSGAATLVPQEPVNAPPPKSAVTLDLQTTPNLQTTNQLKDILLDNIKKVKENPDYIGQAQEISKQVGQVINVIRTEMECLRLAKDLSGLQ